MNLIIKHITVLLLTLTLSGQLLQSSILHLCLNDKNIEILSEFDKEDHCVVENQKDTCCSVEEEKENCDDCYNIELEDEREYLTNKISDIILCFTLLSNNLIISESPILNQISINNFNLPPPYFLIDYLSESFLRGPTKNSI